MLQPSVPAWFEIPVVDRDHAQRFNEARRGTSMTRQRYTGDTDQAVLPPDLAGGARAHPSVREGHRVDLACVEVAR